MEEFIYKVGILCIFTMITGILIDLGCFPATEKIIKFLAAAYIVVSAVASFKSVQFDFDLNNYDRQLTYELNTDVVKYKIIEETETKLENIIKNRLDEKNISYNTVYLHILEQNDNMEVSEIYIQCDEEYINSATLCIQDIISKDTKITIGE